MKDKTNSMFQAGGTEISVLNFPSFGFIWLRFVSDPSTRLRTGLDIRISDFSGVNLDAIGRS